MTHPGTEAPDRRELLALYDAQLRTAPEMVGATDITRLGPLWMGTFPGGVGFVSYRGLDGVAPADMSGLVEGALTHFRSAGDISEIEWKTRSHDRAPGLEHALVAAGFHEGEPESVMVGAAEALALDVGLPPEVTIRRATSAADVRACLHALERAFGQATPEHAADDLVSRVEGGDPLMEMWMAETAGTTIGSGRLEVVADTDFAGIWGGGMVPEWRGRGIYRAITAARARSALAAGRRWIQSDSTDMSRPILERSGLVRITETTPWTWTSPR